MLPIDLANLLRIAADDELTAEQSDRLRAHLALHPEDEAFVEFERRLRAAVGRVMGKDQAPASLRLAVRASFEPASQALPFGSAAAPWAGRRRPFVPSGLAAGFLLLIGAAVVLSIAAPRDWFDWRRPVHIPIGVEGSLGFPGEHLRCATDEHYARSKLSLQSLDEVRAHLSDDLRWNVPVPDLSSFGYRFLNAGDCSVIGRGSDLIHLRFGSDADVVSVWIERSHPSDLTHSAGLREGLAYRVVPVDRGMTRDLDKAYYAWRRGEYVLRLVPASAVQSREMAVAIGMPDVAPIDFN